MEATIIKFIKKHLSYPPDYIYADIGQTFGTIQITHSDHRQNISDLWNLMNLLDNYFADLTQSDITDLSAHLICNQHDCEGNIYYTFTIKFTYE